MEKYIGVIGSGENATPEILMWSEQVGRLIGESGAILVCGGRGGVMEAACRGAKKAGGKTIGILPGLTRDEANPFVDVAILTGLGLGIRNFITVRSSDVLIMVHGEVGTLSEVIIAYQHKKPVVALEPSGGWASRLHTAAYEDGRYMDTRKMAEIHYRNSPEEAVELAIQLSNNAVILNP